MGLIKIIFFLFRLYFTNKLSWAMDRCHQERNSYIYIDKISRLACHAYWSNIL